MKRKKLVSWIPDLFMAVILIIVAVVMLYPLLYEVFVSFSDANELVKHRGILLWFKGFSLEGYKLVFSTRNVITGYRNTLFIMGFGLVINITLTSCGAYFLARKNVYFHKHITLFFMITMYFSGGLIPFYLVVKGVGLYNSLWALILPTAVSTYNMILLRTYFSTIPDSLVESVMMDGGGHLTALFKIFIPLSKPAMMVMILYYGVGHWNSWFNAKMFLRNKNLFPLQLVLRNILIVGDESFQKSVGEIVNYEQLLETTKAAMVITSTLPFLCIYPFVQKYFEGGMMIGSLKE